MTSLAWKHHKKVIAQREAAKAAALKAETKAPEAPEGDSKHELLLKAIDVACKRISEQPKGSQARLELKKEALATYLPVIEEYIAAGEVYENTALTQVMIWAFDVGDIENAMRLARIAIEQNQPLPERFNRDLKSGVCDFVYDWCALMKKQKKEIEPYFAEIFEQLFPADKSPGWSVCAEIQLKYLKIAIDATEDPERGLELCNIAEAIDPVKAKVATRKAKFEKSIAALKEAEKYKK